MKTGITQIKKPGNIMIDCMITHTINPMQPIRQVVDYTKLYFAPGAKITTGPVSNTRHIVLCADGYHRMKRPHEIKLCEISNESVHKLHMYHVKYTTIENTQKIQSSCKRRWLRYPSYLSCSSGAVNGVILI